MGVKHRASRYLIIGPARPEQATRWMKAGERVAQAVRGVSGTRRLSFCSPIRLYGLDPADERDYARIMGADVIVRVRAKQGATA